MIEFFSHKLRQSAHLMSALPFTFWFQARICSPSLTLSRHICVLSVTKPRLMTIIWRVVIFLLSLPHNRVYCPLSRTQGWIATGGLCQMGSLLHCKVIKLVNSRLLDHWPHFTQVDIFLLGSSPPCLCICLPGSQSLLGRYFMPLRVLSFEQQKVWMDCICVIWSIKYTTNYFRSTSIG